MHGLAVHASHITAHALHACRKAWLQAKGSPKSVIDKAVFSEERQLSTYTHPAFDIRR